jgi:multidrug resistance efflux pump
MRNAYINTQIEEELNQTSYDSFKTIYQISKHNRIKKWLWGILIGLLVILFLPWTQNIRAKGNVTTLYQEGRPQELNTIIAGRVMKWKVKEGDFVKKGDTILQLGEVKPEYFDPKLLERTQQQINAKQMAIEAYEQKANTANAQIGALESARELKLNQLEIKTRQLLLKQLSDSNDVVAVNNEWQIAKRQIESAKTMLDSGVIALIDFERRKATYQNAIAKKVSAENKLLQTKQELQAIKVEINFTIQEYADKIAKAQGERYGSMSNMSSGAADVSKLENLYSNYDIRNQLYYITAPQNGQVTKAKKAGIGEMVKEGEMLVEIVPEKAQLAVELYIDPMDLPLINIGQPIRFIFDGYPAIVFSGWPAASYGTFSGIISAIERSTSDNGKFRILAVENKQEKPWPAQLRIGGGASGIALLKNVSIGYELWRNINGFPPEYYQVKSTNNQAKKK